MLKSFEDDSKEFKLETEDEMQLAPPVFSRVDIPLDYSYKRNPLFKIQEIPSADPSQVRLISNNCLKVYLGTYEVGQETQENDCTYRIHVF